MDKDMFEGVEIETSSAKSNRAKINNDKANRADPTFIAEKQQKQNPLASARSSYNYAGDEHHHLRFSSTSSSIIASLNTARNSLPIPVAVTLRNLFPPSVKQSFLRSADHSGSELDSESGSDSDIPCNVGDASANNDAWRTPHHVRLLGSTHSATQAMHQVFVPVILQIVVPSSVMSELSQQRHALPHSAQEVEQQGGRKKEEDGDEEEGEVILVSILQDRMSSHPLWDHIDERLNDWYGNHILSKPMRQNRDDDNDNNDNSGYKYSTDTRPNIDEKKLWESMYKAMKVRIIGVFDDANHDHMLTVRRTRVHKTDNSGQDRQRQKKEQTVILGEAPLYPNKLLRLPDNTYDTMNNSKDTQPTATSSIIGKSKYASVVPKSLPTNSILIHYTDGLTRVLPTLYDLLLKKSIIQEEVGSIQKLEEDFVAKRLAKRFDDDIFDVLGGGGGGNVNNKRNNKLHVNNTCKGATGQTKIVQIPHSGLGEKSTTTETNGHCRNVIMEKKKSDQDTSSNAHKSGFFTNDSHLFDLLGNGEPHEDISCHQRVVVTGEKDRVIGKETDHVCAMGILDQMPPQEESMIDDLSNKVKYLRSMLNFEEKLLQEEKDNLRLTLGNIQTLTRQIKEVDEEREDIDHEISCEMTRCAESSFLLEAKQRKLLKGLKDIYPIQSLPGAEYSIGGIHLPHDLNSFAASDELISAGLGFVCHLVSMSSKYLSIPLRYGLIYNSSRSAVQDDNDIFPLFREKIVYKVQFDRAIVLLNRNIDLLLRVRGINAMQSSERPHILAKLYVFFEKIVEINGDDDSCSNLSCNN